MRPGARQPGVDALADALPLELGERRQDVQLQLAGGRRRVDAGISDRPIRRGTMIDGWPTPRRQPSSTPRGVDRKWHRFTPRSLTIPIASRQYSHAVQSNRVYPH
jgi:hypothetical protein